MSDSSFFDDLRAGFSFVAAHADHVHIDREKIKEYADEVLAQSLPDTFDDDHHFVSGNIEHDFGYVLLLDSVNFGSGYRDALQEEGSLAKDESFYFAIAQRLKNRFTEQPLTPQDVLSLSPPDVMHMFGLVAAPHSSELGLFYHQALQDMAKAVDRPHGCYEAFVKAMDGKVGNCVSLLAQQPKFQDFSLYKNREIGLYKRAQITAADLHLSAAQSDVALFTDIQNLTMFADNAVPHVLHQDGILRYSASLKQRIIQKQALAHGSPREVEIRACAAHAVELIAQETGLKAMDVDHRLWHRSEETAYQKKTSHKTHSLFY